MAAIDAAESVPGDNINQKEIDNITADDERSSETDNDTCKQQLDNIIVDVESNGVVCETFASIFNGCVWKILKQNYDKQTKARNL